MVHIIYLLKSVRWFLCSLREKPKVLKLWKDALQSAWPLACKLSDLISYHTSPGLICSSSAAFLAVPGQARSSIRYLLLVLPGTHFLQMTGLIFTTFSRVCSSLPVSLAGLYYLKLLCFLPVLSTPSLFLHSTYYLCHANYMFVV